MENKPLYAIIHHTADASKSPQLQKVEAYHKLRFNMRSSLGFYTGYHYFIERDGTRIQTRDIYEEGAHAKGRNSEAVGIALAGNFDFEEPSFAQLQQLENTRKELSITLGIPNFHLEYHFNFSDTHCPGAYFRGDEWRAVILNNQLTFLRRVLLWLKSLRKN